MPKWVIVEDEPNLMDTLLAMFEVWDVDGLSFSCQERFKTTRIVIVTSYERSITQADRQLIDKIMLKPIQKMQLVQAIQELLRKKS